MCRTLVDGKMGKNNHDWTKIVLQIFFAENEKKIMIEKKKESCMFSTRKTKK